MKPTGGEKAGFKALIGLTFVCDNETPHLEYEVEPSDITSFDQRHYRSGTETVRLPSVLCPCGARVYLINGKLSHEYISR